MQRCSQPLSTASALRSIFSSSSSSSSFSSSSSRRSSSSISHPQICVSVFLAPSHALSASAVAAALPPFIQRRQQHQQIRQLHSTRRNSIGNSSNYCNNNGRPPTQPARDVGGFRGGAGGGSRGPGGPGGLAGRRPPHRAPRGGPAANAAALRKFGVQEARRPINEEIPSREITLIGGLTGKESGSASQSKAAVLSRLDLQVRCLVQVGQEGQNALCRVMDRKDYFEYEQRKAKKQAANKKATKVARQLEMNWTIDQNDSGHRLRKALELLDKGNKLEVTLSPKKRAAPATADQCEALISLVKNTILDAGHKEWKPIHGKPGRMLYLYFEPKG